MSQILDMILSDENIKFKDAISLLKNELERYSYFEQKEIRDDLEHAFNFTYFNLDK